MVQHPPPVISDGSMGPDLQRGTSASLTNFSRNSSSGFGTSLSRSGLAEGDGRPWAASAPIAPVNAIMPHGAAGPTTVPSSQWTSSGSAEASQRLHQVPASLVAPGHGSALNVFQE